MTAIYALGTMCDRRWHGKGDMRGYCPTLGWMDRDEFMDIYSIPACTLAHSLCWIVGPKE